MLIGARPLLGLGIRSFRYETGPWIRPGKVGREVWLLTHDLLLPETSSLIGLEREDLYCIGMCNWF